MINRQPIDYLDITLTKSVLDRMVKHCQSELPNEACGYLAQSDSIIDSIYPMTNIDASPDHFSFDPREQFAVVKQVRAAKQRLAVVYHSHPETPARLSAEDLKLLNDPNMVYIIVSMVSNPPVVKAFKINKDADDINVSNVNIEVKE